MPVAMQRLSLYRQLLGDVPSPSIAKNNLLLKHTSAIAQWFSTTLTLYWLNTGFLGME